MNLPGVPGYYPERSGRRATRVEVDRPWMIRCCKCQRVLNISEFSRRASETYGVDYDCRHCRESRHMGRRKLATKLVGAARRRAAQRGLEFDLEVDAIEAAMRAGRCEMTGVPFEFERKDDVGRVSPFAPSLDRIDSSRGYTRDNVKVVVAAFNLGKNEFSLDVFRQIAVGFISLNPST